jgi:hypothetical protein
MRPKYHYCPASIESHHDTYVVDTQSLPEIVIMERYLPGRPTLLFTILLLAFWGSLAAAPLPPLIDRELFFGDPEIAGAQLSPDGTFVSFLKPLNGVRNVWVKRTDEPFDKARPVTNDTKRAISGVVTRSTFSMFRTALGTKTSTCTRWIPSRRCPQARWCPQHGISPT